MDYPSLMQMIELVIQSHSDKIKAGELRIQAIQSNQHRVFDVRLYRDPNGKFWTAGKTASDNNGSVNVLRYDPYDPSRNSTLSRARKIVSFGIRFGSASSLPEGSVKASDPHLHAWAWRDPQYGESPGQELSAEICSVATLRGELESIQQFQETFLRHRLEVSSVLSRSNDVNWAFNLLVWLSSKVTIRDSVQLRVHEALDNLRIEIERIK